MSEGTGQAGERVCAGCGFIAHPTGRTQPRTAVSSGNRVPVSSSDIDHLHWAGRRHRAGGTHCSPGVVPYTDPTHEAHVSEPGPVVVDVVAVDDDAALYFQQMLAERWATVTAERATPDAGEPGVRLCCYLDLRQPVSQGGRDEALPPVSAAASP